jgi:uncharacterized oligopeptide transporter (OPT) family protein
MLQDLKSGHVLGASPRTQFIAQGVGTIFGIVATVFGFILFSEAYPCILENPSSPKYTCAFGMPGVYAWYGLALGLTSGFDHAIPQGAGWSALAWGILAGILMLLKHKIPKKYAKFVPNPVALGVGFMTPAIIPLAIMFFFGALISHFWQKYSESSFELYMIVISAGMVGGEGVGGIVNAVLTISGVEGIWCGGIPEGYC